MSTRLTPAAGGGVGCLFCAVVTGSSPAHVVLDEADVVAFLDIRPVFKGHTLVVPRAHVPTLLELSPAGAPVLVAAVQRVAGALITALGAQGSFVAVNNVVSQSVPHLHVHVVPRTKGDGLRGFFWPRTRYADEDEAQECAARLGAALASTP